MGSYLFLAARTLSVVVLAAALWPPFLANPYDGLVVQWAGAFLPEGIATRAGESRIYLDFLGGEPGAGLNINGFVLHFGLILVMALVVTTPNMGLLRALAWTVAVLGLFLGLHVVGLALFARGLKVATSGGDITVGQVMAAFAVFWALLPAVIGGAWCYRYWLPALRSPLGRKATAGGEASQGKRE